MLRYKVAVVANADEAAIELVVPSSDLTVALFVDNAIKRASKHSSNPLTISETTELRLNSPTGFHVDADDNLSDVLTPSDILFVLLKVPHKIAPFESKSLPQKLLTSTANAGTFQIRVITPSAAIQHADIRQIPLLKGGHLFSGESTLHAIKDAICDHLGLQLDTRASGSSCICNCKLAEQLLERGNWQKYICDGHSTNQNDLSCHFATMETTSTCARCSLPLIGHQSITDEDGTCKVYVLARQDLPCGHVIHSSCIDSNLGHWSCPKSCQSVQPFKPTTAPTKCVVVSGAHVVEMIEVEHSTMSGIMSGLKLHFGDEFETTQCVHTKGGLEVYGGGYSVLPIIAVCSIAKHESNGTGVVSAAKTLPSPVLTTLDLHTAESPVNTQHLEQTINQVGLADLCVGGILCLYVLSRKGTRQLSENRVGKNGTFTSAPYWKASAAQSDRGTSAFLSSLRMFAHVTGSTEFADFQQNEILGIVHQLTRFPPTVRAMHIVMSGKSLRNNESAAIVHSFDALLQMMIPLTLVGNDYGRLLEGSRLLFGLIIARMRKEKRETGEHAVKPPPQFPYIKGYHTADLRDIKLSDPISCTPLQTTFGLIDENVYLAHENGGVFGHTPADAVGAVALTPDFQVLRVARLSDGLSADVTYYDSDVLAAALQSSTFGLALKDLKTFSTDLKYVASLCEDTSMAVVRPRSLATASVPSLTLSREGHLSVNLGHAPCSHNMLIFKPVSGTEEELDAAVVEQLLEPIVEARQRDGTAVFDVFGTTHNKKSTVPSELLMFVVDASNSMDKNSDFAELSDLQDDPVMRPSGTGDLVLDEHDASTVLYSEIKDWLLAHESFPDMVALVHGASSARSMPTVATEVLRFLRKLTSRELAFRSKEQVDVLGWASQLYMRGQSPDTRVDKLRRYVSGLELFEKTLIDLLVFRARDPDYSPTEFEWHYGEPIPVDDCPVMSGAAVDLTAELVVPENFICPISQAVFEDPVRTCDMLGPFDRRAIERWFRVRQSSPLTGLPLYDVTLRHDQALHDEVKHWISGEDIVAAASPAHKRTRRSTHDALLSIKFVTPTGSFTRRLPPTLTTAALHRVAFRGMRGVHSVFNISHRGNMIAPSADDIARQGLAQDSELVIHTNTASGQPNVEDMCLVKVYLSYNAFQNSAFWLSRRTTSTMATILFKNWRANQHNHLRNKPDCQIWSGLYYGGDQLNFGTRNNSWDKVTALFEELQPQTLIRHERIVAESREGVAELDEASDEEDDLTGEVVSSYKSYRVLKLELEKYISPEALEEEERRKLRMFTRMAVSKQVFNAFINRLIAYNFPTTVGLVTFGSRALLSQAMTDVVENFRTALNKTETSGDTALWDAVHLAADQLLHRRERDPNLKCRIICLSDGRDTNSTRRVEEVCQTLVRNEIVLDSVSIGKEDNLDLRTVSYLTGGYAFVPKKLEDAVGVCELEPVLSQHERPSIVRPIAPALLSAQAFRLATVHANPTPFTRDNFPQRKSHPGLEDTFVKVSALQGRNQGAASDESQGDIQSGIRTRRLLTEIRDISVNPHPSYDVFVSEANMGFWKVVIAGPPGSAYDEAAFMLYLDMPEQYPRVAPKGRFVTPIFHPNISRHGLICHSIFDRNWTADTTIRQVLDTVFGLLLVPEFSEPINTTVILAFYWDEVQFREEVKRHIEKFATKTREELGGEILGEL